MRHLRHTARGIVIHEGRLLLIERFRDGRHYFSIPGGGIEAGETPAETVVREMLEETSCAVRVQRPLYLLRHDQVEHHFFLCEYLSGEPQLPPDSEEALRSGPHNRFNPRWLPLDELSDVPFSVWRPIQERLVIDLSRGFRESTTEIIAEPVL